MSALCRPKFYRGPFLVGALGDEKPCETVDYTPSYLSRLVCACILFEACRGTAELLTVEFDLVFELYPAVSCHVFSSVASQGP